MESDLSHLLAPTYLKRKDSINIAFDCTDLYNDIENPKS